MNNKILITFAVLAVLLTPNLVQAWGPYTTLYLNNEMKKDPTFQSSSIGQISIQNWDMFQACAIWTDISVIHYLTEGYKYEATHNHRLPDAVLADAEDDRMRACAYGIEIGHLVGDSVAHSQYVPKMIEASSIPNIPIHPLLEAAVEAEIIRDHPQIFSQGQGVLDIVANDEVFLDKMQSYVMSSSGVVLDVEQDTKFFQDILGSQEGFYSRAFVLPEMYKAVGYGYAPLGIALFLVIAGVGLFIVNRSKLATIILSTPFIFTIIMIASAQMQAADLITVTFFWGTALGLTWFLMERKFTRILPILWLGFIGFGAIILTFGGIATFVDTSDADYYMDMAIDNQIDTSTSSGWTTRYKYDPTGFEKISESDSKVIFTDALFIGLFAGVILFLAWFFRWRNK